MTEATTAERAKTPVHLWIIGILTLLWNSMGAFDYLMTETRNAAYMKNFTQAQLDYFYGFPAWVIACWALAVWGGVLGSLLLLLRKKIAVPVLLVSLLSMIVTTIHNYLLTDGMKIMGGTGPLVFTAVIFLVALGLWLYARGMRQRGVLA